MQARSWHDFVEFDDAGNFQSYKSYDWESLFNARHSGDAHGGAELETHANGGVITGSLNNENGGDMIAVVLNPGQTYTFSYRGTATGGVVDPWLRLYAADQTTLIREDDDGGYGRSAQITFTSATGGTYYLNASSWYQVDPAAPDYQDNGAYTISQWSPEADVPGTIAGAVLITPGTTFGNLDSGTDTDFFKISVTAGQVYAFSYSGGVSGAGDFDGEPGENLGYLRLYNADGSAITANLVNYETGTSYYARQDGEIYVRIQSYYGTGGYTLDTEVVDPSTRDPLQSLNWDSADNIDTVPVDGVQVAYVYFAPAGQNFGEKEPDGVTPMTTYGWEQHQIDAVMSALEEYTPITGIEYRVTTDVSQAEFRMLTTSNLAYGARFYPQDPAYGTQQGIGTFNLRSGGFGTDPASLLPGGYSYEVILHEFGHAHGIAHPHDTGGGSEIMLGVTGSTGSLGVYDLNQGVYTVMSYNSGWVTHPDGTRNYSTTTRGSGWNQTLGAFDIAVLQDRYGVHAYETGDNVYMIADTQATAAYRTIWDTAGIDTIAYSGARDAQIDLLAATLDYTPTGGGVLSFAHNVWGGYTIANGVVVENATGGSGNDVLLGNAAANVLTGNDGNDSLVGRDGNDSLLGGAGNDLLDGGNGADTINGGDGDDVIGGAAGNDVINGGAGVDRVEGGDGLDVVTLGGGNDVFVAEVSATKQATRAGLMSVDIITDFDASGNDLIDVSGLGVEFNFRSTNSNKNAGDLTYKTYDSITGAENALGFDIDGQPGAGGVSGPVTVVYGNIDGGGADFAIVLLNTSNVSADDFIYV